MREGDGPKRVRKPTRFDTIFFREADPLETALKNLFFAVLDRAERDLYEKDPYIFRNAIIWFKHFKQENHLFSFPSICFLLDINPEDVLERHGISDDFGEDQIPECLPKRSRRRITAAQPSRKPESSERATAGSG